MIDPQELRDLIKQYGPQINEETYKAIYDFGIWYANQQDASDVVLSDWTPTNLLPVWTPIKP